MKQRTIMKRVTLAALLLSLAAAASASPQSSTLVFPTEESNSNSGGDLILDYSVIQSTGKFCPGRDSCRQTSRNHRGPEFVENDWKRRNCFCDDACATYGDCCIDARAYEPAQQQEAHKRFGCLNLKQYGDVYIADKCPRGWDMPNIRKACEEPDEVSDPFGTTPVTNSVSGITYRNYYCAVCNADSVDIQFWRPRLACPTLTGYSKRFKNLTRGFIEDRLAFDPGKRQWGVTLDTGGVPVFHECYVDPAVPETLVSKVRPCSGKDTVTDCPADYSGDAATADLCRSYTAMVFEPNAAYRNVHCAVCNAAALDRLICLNLGPFGRFNWHQNFDSFSFAVLFDIGGDADDDVGTTEASPKCDRGELFDPFFKKCRNVVCGDDGEIFRHGRCYDPRRPSTARSTTTTTPSTTTTTAKITTTETTSTTTASPETTTESQSSTSSTSTTSPTTTTTEPTTTEPTTTTSPPPTKPSEEFLLCPKFALDASEYLVLEGGTVFVERYGRHLEASAYEVDDAGRIFICAPDEALVQDGGGDDLSRAKFGPGLSVVTFLCLGLSSTCCAMHLVATSFVPELRNLNGKNLASLTASLLGGYVSFVAGMFNGGSGGGSAGCYFLAVSIYFFFTAGFAWMLVIAYDIFRTLKRATTQLRLTAGSQWKRFAGYSALAWLTPCCLVAAAVLSDRVEGIVPEEFRPGFALSDLCWFSRKRALLLFFAGPFCVVAAANAALFAASACMVYDTTRTNAKHVSSCGGPRTNFRLYFRLAVIMGLTWTVGLAAAVLDDSEPAWYVFVVLNTLQGVFIFAFFTCTRKVGAAVRQRLEAVRPGFLRMVGSNISSSSETAGGIGAGGDPSWRLTNSTKGSHDSSSSSTSSNRRSRSRSGFGPDSSDLYSATRGKTVYTVSSRQVNGAINQKSFDGRYF